MALLCADVLSSMTLPPSVSAVVLFKIKLDRFSNRKGTSVDDLKARKGLNTTSGAQFAALPLIKPVV